MRMVTDVAFLFGAGASQGAALGYPSRVTALEDGAL